MKSATRGRGQGGRGGHEPRLRIRERERRALELALEGHSQTQIAAELGISQPAVSKILRRIEERLSHNLAGLWRRLQVRTALRLDRTCAESLRAWERSKGPRTIRRQRKILRGGGEESTVAELVTQERDGDPRYLEAARRSSADLRAMGSLDLKDRPADGTVKESLEHVPTEEVKRRLERTYAMLSAEYECPPWPPITSASEDPAIRESSSPTTLAVGDQTPRPLTAEQAYAEFLAQRAKGETNR